MVRNNYECKVILIVVLFFLSSLSATLVNFKRDYKYFKTNRYDSEYKKLSEHINGLEKSEHNEDTVPIIQLGPKYYIEHLISENANLDTYNSGENLSNKGLNGCYDLNGELLLHNAAKNGDIQVVVKISQHKKLLNCLDESGKSPSWYAATNKHWSTLAVLLRSGATLTKDIQDSKAWDELFHSDANLKKLFDQLQPKDISKEIKREKLDGILIWACMKGYTNLTQFLIDLGANINSPKFRNSQLWLPLTRGNFNMADFLISKGANINGKSQHGLTLLHIAAVVDQVPVLEYLLGKGLDINIKANNGLTPLDMAKGAAWSYIKSRGGKLANEL